MIILVSQNDTAGQLDSAYFIKETFEPIFPKRFGSMKLKLPLKNSFTILLLDFFEL